MEAQIPVDFVSATDLVGGKLAQYKILYLPFPVMLSRDVGEALKGFIKAGGTVVAEARLAWNDERGFASEVVPGFGLSEVFGAREVVMRPVEKAEIHSERGASLPGWAAGSVAQGEAFEEELEPKAGAQILARFADGKPAMVRKQYGKGQAVLIGSYLAIEYLRHQTTGTKALLLSLARSAGVSAEVSVSGENTGEVEAQRLVDTGFQLVFIFNHASKAAQATIAVQLPWKAVTVQSWLDGTIAPHRQDVDRCVVQRDLAAGEVYVVKMSRE